MVLTSELASVVSVASNVHFQCRMKLLKDLIKHWKCGEEVDLVEVDEGKQVVIMVCNKGIIFITHTHTHTHTHMNIVDSEVSLSGDDGEDGEHNEQVAPQTRKILILKAKKQTNDNPSPEKRYLHVAMLDKCLNSAFKSVSDEVGSNQKKAVSVPQACSSELYA